MKFVPIVDLIAILLLANLGTSFSQTTTLQWDPSPDPAVIGYNLYYGQVSQVYTNLVAAGVSATATISNLVPGLVYYFAATTINSAGLESGYSGEVAYQIGSTPCGILVSGTVQTFDGTPKLVTVTTVPANLPYVVTYAGLLDAPIEPGVYPVTVAITDPNYTSGFTETLTINRSHGTVQVGRTQAPSAATTSVLIGNPNYTGSAMSTISISGSATPLRQNPVRPPSTIPRQAPAIAPSTIISWPSTASDVTLWESADLAAWSPLTSVSGNSNSFQLVPQAGARFFRATVVQAGGVTRIPLTIVVPTSVSSRPIGLRTPE